MNKAQLVARIAKDTGLTKADTTRMLDAFLDVVTRTLRKGEKATLVGFGVFGVAKRRARTGRNPRTGAPIRIPARRLPRFIPGKALKAAVR